MGVRRYSSALGRLDLRDWGDTQVEGLQFRSEVRTGERCGSYVHNIEVIGVYVFSKQQKVGRDPVLGQWYRECLYSRSGRCP